VAFRPFTATPESILGKVSKCSKTKPCRLSGGTVAQLLLNKTAKDRFRFKKNVPVKKAASGRNLASLQGSTMFEPEAHAKYSGQMKATRTIVLTGATRGLGRGLLDGLFDGTFCW
jgi:hypothetical protein